MDFVITEATLKNLSLKICQLTKFGVVYQDIIDTCSSMCYLCYKDNIDYKQQPSCILYSLKVAM